MQKAHGPKFFIVFLLLSLAMIVCVFWAYVSSIVLALLITSVFHPVYVWARKRFRGRENLAALLMVFVIFFSLIVPLSWFVGTLSNEAFDFYNKTHSTVSLSQIQKILESDSVWANRIKKLGEMTGIELTPENLENLATSLGKNVGLFLYKQIRSIAANLLSFLIHFLLMILTIFYLLREGERLKEYLFQLIPVPMEQLEKIVSKFREMGEAIIVGNGLSGIVQGILGGFGFFFFGIASPFLWGTVIAFMAFLPIIGASVVFIPAAIILFVQGKTGAGMGFLTYNLLYSSVIEYLIKPKVIGQGMQMNSLLVFIGIIGGIKLFGILGIIYGPLIITIFLTLAEIYRLEYRDRSA